MIADRFIWRLGGPSCQGCAELRARLERAEGLLDEAEPDVWATCGCEPKKPDWWGGGDQSELRPYENRAAERTRRCDFHKRYDAFLRGDNDD